jgi:acyl-CoA reductase-like NAD-dependent aldehyde dehydrogenase
VQRAWHRSACLQLQLTSLPACPSARQVDAAIKAAAKKAEEERRKGAAKERQELEKAMAAQLTQVCVGRMGGHMGA